MAKANPETVYKVVGNNHNAERVIYSIFAKEETARFRAKVCNDLNPNCNAVYEPIKWADIPRGWKSKVKF